MPVVNLEKKFSSFKEHWNPKIIGELNGQVVKIARIKGEFIWHKHELEDEFFLVVRGYMQIKLRGEDVQINEGEFYIVPRGVEHKPVADEETWILMFEPQSTLNTGNVVDERTQEDIEHI